MYWKPEWKQRLWEGGVERYKHSERGISRFSVHGQIKSERVEEWAIGWMVRLFTNRPQEEAEQGAWRAQVITKGSWKCGSGLITFHRFSAMTVRYCFLNKSITGDSSPVVLKSELKNNLESLLKHRFLGSNPSISDLVGLGHQAQEFVFPASSVWC